jgi:hypothetical protein
MGQQQLLLVILVTILVGIATVVGINVFGDSAENANQDAVRNDIAQIASSAQGWVIKPEVMGGGGNKFTDLDFRDITFPYDTVLDSDTLVVSNLNGTYKIATDANKFTITANPSSAVGYDATTTDVVTTVDNFKAEVNKDGFIDGIGFNEGTE